MFVDMKIAPTLLQMCAEIDDFMVFQRKLPPGKYMYYSKYNMGLNLLIASIGSSNDLVPNRWQ